MKTKAIIIISLLLLSMLLAGCITKKDIIGCWESETNENISIEITEDIVITKLNDKEMERNTYTYKLGFMQMEGYDRARLIMPDENTLLAKGDERPLKRCS